MPSKNSLYHYGDQFDIGRNNMTIRSNYSKFSIITVRVIEIIDFHDTIVINNEYIYYKNRNLLQQFDKLFCTRYDGYACYALQKGREHCQVMGEKHTMNSNVSIKSIADFIKIIREQLGEEFDQLLVDYGTLIYKKKPDPGIKINGKQLSDVMFVYSCSDN